MLAETTSANWQSFAVDLSGARVLALVSMADRRPIVSTVCLASQFTVTCTSTLQTLQTTYAEEPDSYKADAYWSGGRLWMKCCGRLDRAVMVRIV